MNKKYFDMYSFEDEISEKLNESEEDKPRQRRSNKKTHSSSNRDCAIDDNYAIDSFEAIDKDIKYSVDALSQKLQDENAIGVKKCTEEICEGFNRMVGWQDKYKISSPYLCDENDPVVIENKKKMEQGIRDYEQLLRDIEDTSFSNYSFNAKKTYELSHESGCNNVAKSNLDGVIENIKDIGFAFMYNVMKPFLDS